MSGARRIGALAAGLTALTMVLLAGCTLGPSQRPALATYGPGPAATVTTTAPASGTVGPGGPGQQADPIRWQSCADVADTDPTTGQQFDVDCATVVTEGSAVGSAGRRSIEVARARAAGVADDAPVLVVLDGSPGQHGRSDVAAVAAGLSPAVRQHFAVVTVDLAGSGDADPIDCISRTDLGALATLGADPTQPEGAKALAEVTRSITFECTDQGGPDLPLVNTTEAADDLDHLRAALGTDRLTVLGRGAGATLGTVYADRYPGRVQAAVLDAPANPMDAADARAAAVGVAAEKALDAFAAACPTFSGGCPLGADPRGTVEKTVAQLDAAATPGTGRVTGGSVLLSLLLGLGDPAVWPGLAGDIAKAGQGDTTALASRLSTALGLSDSRSWVTPALIYACNDTAVRLGPDQLATAVQDVRAQAPLFGPYTLGLLGVCGSWPAPENALGAVKANGAPPILVLGAVDDPVAPYESVRALAGQLASAVLVSWQSGTHGSYPASACAAGAVDGYLLQGQLPAVGTLCPP